EKPGEFGGGPVGLGRRLDFARLVEGDPTGPGVGLEEPAVVLLVDGEVDAELTYEAGHPGERIGGCERQAFDVFDDPVDRLLVGAGLGQHVDQLARAPARMNVRHLAATAAEAGDDAGDVPFPVDVPLYQR